MAQTSDITKQAWKFQEGAVYLAFSEALKDKNNVWWNYQCDLTPEGMSIDPDLLIGNDPKNPDAIIFVTHATMERGSEKKFWRTVAEVIEIKKLDTHPKVLSVLFSSNIKANLMIAYENLFDGVYHMDTTSEGKDVSDFMMELTKKHGIQPPLECLKILKRDFIEISFWALFVAQISKLADSNYGSKHEAMVAISKFKKSRLPKARETSLRRSSCKLFTLSPETRQKLLENKKIKSIPVHAERLEWFRKGIGGYHLVDEELIKLILECDPKNIDIVMGEASKLPTFCSFVENLKGIEVRRFSNKWIIDNFNEICKPKGMLKYMIQVFENPYEPLYGYLAEELCPNTHWLFETMMSLLRTETGRADGYGYSFLGKETGHEYEISALAGVIIAPFLKRQKMLSAELINDISRVFAGHLKRLGKETTESLLIMTELTLCKSSFNYNIATYRHFNPIEWLVSMKLTANSIAYEYPSMHPSFLSADVLGITTTTGNIMKVSNGDIWIKCQSAYDGKTDKRKELCGRIGAMKLSYNPNEIKKKRFYLVIDGFFNNEDLHLLDLAGWDGIYYYDELDLLIEEIEKQ